MNRCNSYQHKATTVMLLSSVVIILLGLPAATVARSGLQSEESAPPFKVQKCRIGCLEKVRFILSSAMSLNHVLGTSDGMVEMKAEAYVKRIDIDPVVLSRPFFVSTHSRKSYRG